jgi:steroid delta-isomerase-like uncharacterized protein
MSTIETTSVVHRIVEAINRGDDARVDELFAGHYVDHDPARPGAEPGPAGVRQAWAILRRAFPDLQVAVHDTVAEGALVAVRGEMTGTHQGDLMGLPATGRQARISVIDFSRIVAGRVTERWAQSDALGLLRQLGAISGPARPTAEAAPGPRASRSAPNRNGHAASVANKAFAVQFAQVVLNDHDLERAGDFLADDFVGYLAGAPGPVVGVDAWREMFGGFLAAVPDYQEDVHEVIAEGDLVALRSTFGGTHAGHLFGMPATGRRFTAGGMAFLRVRDGRIVEQWTEADLVGVLGQLEMELIGGP